MSEYDRRLIRALIQRMDSLGVDWRGGKETYIGELLIDHARLIDAEVGKVLDKLHEGSTLYKRAYIACVTRVRRKLRERRSRNLKQANAIQELAGSIFMQV